MPCESLMLNCLLKSHDLPAAQGRDTLVCLTLEESKRVIEREREDPLQGIRHNTEQSVKCTWRKIILLELRADLFEFQEDAAKVRVTLNARLEDVVWWVLEFLDWPEMRQFKRHILRLCAAEQWKSLE